MLPSIIESSSSETSNCNKLDSVADVDVAAVVIVFELSALLNGFTYVCPKLIGASLVPFVRLVTTGMPAYHMDSPISFLMRDKSNAEMSRGVTASCSRGAISERRYEAI